MEILKYFALKPPLSSPSETEPFVPFDQTVTNNGNKKSPVVRSIMIYRICQALELSVELASFEVPRAPIQTSLRKVRELTPLPAVYSISVFKICQALDLRAELRPQTERSTFGNRKKETSSSGTISNSFFFMFGPWEWILVWMNSKFISDMQAKITSNY
ncbi:hypothetical protein NPIL_523941 [Nephila pilipes]|uniref:Uncharacterized protein n=1 Tax=Nephila pilipes TaxID=299642 RepID=A0A8X6TR11_NEPPI|nr:hypothetical protein NPIL_523941 [Nephila pilipes]